MLLFIFLSIVLFLFFIPVPIKIEIIASKKKLEFYFYKWLIFSLKDKKLKKDFKKKNEKASKKKKSKLSLNFAALISTIYYNKFKPTLKFKFSFKYDLTDAAYTAIFYGYSNLISSLIINSLSLIFKIKKFDSSIEPLFKNDNIFFLNINCIIYLNFAKIIYIFIFYLYNCKTYYRR